jgi:hypothetical protein
VKFVAQGASIKRFKRHAAQWLQAFNSSGYRKRLAGKAATIMHRQEAPKRLTLAAETG